MNLFDYENAKRIKLVDIDHEEWIGTVEDVISGEDNNDGVESIVVRSELVEKYKGKLVEFPKNEIKSIEIID
ncbi:MAG: hypothetical protein ACLUFB_09410 [Ruminococcus sp.]|uniref:hypothetical protein n=1 Tax=Ruminococcus TaxID=1263 RepID=UPI001D025A8A|nr:hypothetical protein [Ruminococcus callidus]MCB5775996.1 hypothetical protein [Ruminococcus callidus]MCC2759693.1 hypothetical protein [Ruminococcus callidus]